MGIFKNLRRYCTPHGITVNRTRRKRLARLGLPSNEKTQIAVDECRYELWPKQLRQAGGITLVDVGANNGDFIRAAKIVATVDCLYAFEPQPNCQQALKESLIGIKGV